VKSTGVQEEDVETGVVVENGTSFYTHCIAGFGQVALLFSRFLRSLASLFVSVSVFFGWGSSERLSCSCHREALVISIKCSKFPKRYFVEIDFVMFEVHF
jgi:hypothetical protein